MFLLVPAYPGSPGPSAVKRLCVCVLYTIRVHNMLEKSLKMLEFGIKTSRPLRVVENR